MSGPRLSRGEQIMLGAGGGLLALSFIPLWGKVRFEAFPKGARGALPKGIVPETSEQLSAWSPAFGVLLRVALILTALIVVLVVARLAGPTVRVPSRSPLYVALAGIALVCIVLVLLTGPTAGGVDQIEARLAGIDLGRDVMMFIGPVLAGILLYGALLHARATDTGA